ncbi:MAG TPA: VTT domain-containing protein [Terriglobales bacterium]
MSHIIPFLLHHGYVVIFASTLLELLGAPISSIPLLLAGGALMGLRRLSAPVFVAVAVLACLIADFTWYRLGKSRGYSILRLLCRISLEPDSCVRRTEDRFARQGGRAMVIAKFIPGLGTAAAPLAGLLRMPLRRFLAWDAVGSLLWVGSYTLAGYLFSSQLDRVGTYLARLGAGLVILLLAGISSYIGWRYRQRRRFIRNLRIARITPEELFEKMQAGEDVFVVDLRGSVAFEADPVRVPRAIRLLPEELEERHQEIPRDRDVVLYCT